MSSKQKNNSLKESWRNTSDLFLELIEQAPGKRMEYLERLAADDPTLRTELKHLLQSFTQSDGFMERPIGPRMFHPSSADVFNAPQIPTGKSNDILSEPIIPVGRKIGDFKLVRVLGSGSLATVYLAKQLSLDRDVALKIGPNFGQEAKAIAHLEHDNIVKVFSESIEPKEKLRIICMQYICGVPLQQVLCAIPRDLNALSGNTLISLLDRVGQIEKPVFSQERLQLRSMDTTESILWVGIQLARALAHAHERGILHLDVKPANILIHISGRPLLTDFNVCHDNRTAQSEARFFGGTLHYMAPEQLALFKSKEPSLKVSELDGRADVFSLGVVLRECFAKFKEKPNSETEIVLGQSLQNNLAYRWSSALEFAKALEGAFTLHRIRKATSTKSIWLKICQKYPLTCLTILGAIPQLVSTVISVSYNSCVIGRALTPQQLSLFDLLLNFYNPALYSIGIVLWLFHIIPIYLLLRKATLHPNAVPNFSVLRQKVLSTPRWIVGLTTLGWMPGSLFFPFILHYYQGPIALKVFGHFFISFGFSCLVALSYSLLIAQTLCFRVLYPKCLLGQLDITKVIHKEVRLSATKLDFLSYLPSVVPLVGCLLILILVDSHMTLRSYGTFNFLISFLVLIGLGGIFFGFRLSRILYLTVMALTHGGQTARGGTESDPPTTKMDRIE